MAIAALVVAIVAVVTAAVAAFYARAQAVAAKSQAGSAERSLVIEQARHEAELVPRFEASVTGGTNPVLRVRLLKKQLPMAGVALEIVKAAGVSFDESRSLPAGDQVVAGNSATLDGALPPGSQMTWPLRIDKPDDGGEMDLNIRDLKQPARVAAVTVRLPGKKIGFDTSFLRRRGSEQATDQRAH